MLKWGIPLILPASAWCQSVGDVWDWQLTPPLDLRVSVDVLDLDPDEIDAADIAALKRRGVYTICYVSVGTLEDWRGDTDDFPTHIIGATYDDWPDERFLDIRAHDVLLPLMKARFRRCAELGFDAVEPDNMDVYSNESGFDLTARDAVDYVLALQRIAHGFGLDIGQKNVPELTPMLSPHMDFAITENCLADGWCDQMAPYTISNRPVFAAEYDVTISGRSMHCTEGTYLGLSIIFKDLDLTSKRADCR